jgi:ribosomal protein S18 acetylase RimI-like enzyme
MSEIKYRKANSKDATAISLLWAEFFDYHFSVDPLYQRKKDSEKDIADLLIKAVDDENKFICVAECNESVIGYIWCEIDKKLPCFENRLYGLVSDIAVNKKYRGKGIAKSLLKNGLDWFKTKDIKHIEARVLLANPLATKFWTSSGFKPFIKIFRYKLNK